MTHVVTDQCVKCKYLDCIEVCPVDCFYEGELMVVIDPQSCIDCGVCVSECPVKAIKPEAPELLVWAERAGQFASFWPNITKKKSPLPDADKFANEANKFEKYIKQ
jgi:ferredoxin